MRVLVREGVVEVTHPGATEPVRATAGGLATVSAQDSAIAVQAVGPQEVARGLAWRDGMLWFNGESLTEAAAEFDRYSTTRIVIADPALGRQTLTGLFSASDPQGFAKAAAAALGGKVSGSANEVRIYR